MENEPQDTFGTGLRAYLGRHTPEEETADGSDPGSRPTDQPEPSPTLTPEEQLARREQELAAREQQLGEHIQAFEAHLTTLARREAQLREREATADELAQAAAERRPVREALREHAEVSLSRIFQVFDEAMTATDPGGSADHGVRLAAVRALLAEAYAKDGDPSATAAIVDELAEMRHRRTAGP